MYRTCIFCAGRLGENESLRSFPVGRSVAFDGERGRLWQGSSWTSGLEAAWKDAEEIAAIADLLPEDPLRRLMGR